MLTNTSSTLNTVSEEALIQENVEHLNDVDVWTSYWWSSIRSLFDSNTRGTVAKKLNVSEQHICNLLRDEPNSRMSTVIGLFLAANMAPHLVAEPLRNYACRRYFDLSVDFLPNGELRIPDQLNVRQLFELREELSFFKNNEVSYRVTFNPSRIEGEESSTNPSTITSPV